MSRGVRATPIFSMSRGDGDDDIDDASDFEDDISVTSSPYDPAEAESADIEGASLLADGSVADGMKPVALALALCRCRSGSF